jgi:hypothetical protein
MCSSGKQLQFDLTRLKEQATMTELEKTGGTMNCGVVAELLETFFEGQLNARAQKSVQEHLDGCTACSVRLASLQRKSQAPGDAAFSDGRSGAQARANKHWWRSTPRLAFLAVGLAAVVVPASLWVVSARSSGESHTSNSADRLPAVVSLRGVGDNEIRTAGFTLTRPADIRVYALGEGQGGEMYDFGLIADAATGRPVWEMEYSETDHAGGGQKNRIVDRVLSLDAGNYLVQYRSDGSHSYDDWNTEPPDDKEAWGITVSAAHPSELRAIEPYEPSMGHDDLGRAVTTATGAALEVARVAAAEAVRAARADVASELRRARSDAGVVARLVRVGDDADLRERFSLDHDSQIRVYALGEGTLGELHDYAWIEDATTGRPVWRMTYKATDNAGGADKNRVADEIIELPAGVYLLRYRSDDSHSFEGWNQAAPPDADNYGVTLFLEGS